jgi:hypothetical protein
MALPTEVIILSKSEVRSPSAVVAAVSAMGFLSTTACGQEIHHGHQSWPGTLDSQRLHTTCRRLISSRRSLQILRRHHRCWGCLLPASDSVKVENLTDLCGDQWQ